MNVAIVRGRLSSPPRVTEFDSGDVLVRYEVTVAHEDGPADSVPVAWLGAEPAAPSDDLEPGDEVVVVGRVRRRWYRPAAGAERSTTEVVAARRTGVAAGGGSPRRRRRAAPRAAAADQRAAVVPASPRRFAKMVATTGRPPIGVAHA